MSDPKRWNAMNDFKESSLEDLRSNVKGLEMSSMKDLRRF